MIITDIKQAEEILRRYELLAEYSRDIILLVRRDDGRILEANAAAVNTYGYNSEELLGLTIKELRAPQTVGLADAQMAEADSHGILFETLHRRRDGSTFPVEVSSQGATIGGIRTLISVIRDITERKHAEDELRASEEKFSTMLQTVPIAIALATSPDGTLYNVNPAWLDLTGFTLKEEVIGKTSLELGLIADAAQRQSVLNEFRQNGFVRNVELTFCARKGVQRTVLVNLDRVEIGGRAFILSTMEEITERKRAEEELQRANENLELRVRERTAELSAALDTLSGEIAERKLVEGELQEAIQFSEQVISSTQEGVIVYDLNLSIRVWNPFMEQISGIPAGDVLGKLPSEFFPFVEDLGIVKRLEKVLRGDLPAPIDFPYSITKTGRSGWASQLSSPLLNTKSEIVGVISTVREISRRKQLETELTRSLEAANTANSNMRRLLRTIAHEFRTPLGLLAGSTDILDRYWDRLTPEKRLEQNEKIRNATHQISNLVDSVISFQLSGTDRPSNPPLLQDIRDICRSIAAEVETVWGTGQEFIVSIAADCGSALLDKTLFRRVLQNLLSNAFRYTLSNGTVSLCVRREKNMLLLEITDTGIGIPKEDQELIFDAFYRSRNVEGRRGLGLGLSIVREALSQMGGAITLTSSAGDGTTMRVEIPVVEPGSFCISNGFPQ